LPKETIKQQITVVVVNWFSNNLLLQLLDNLTAKAVFPERLHFFIVDNTNGEDREIGQLKRLYKRVHIEEIHSGNLKGSWAHAHGLNFATNRVQTPYTVVMDPDIHLFKEQWDEFLIGELVKHEAMAIGAPYPSWKLGKYHQFPSPPFIFYKTSVLKTLGLDWSPFPKAFSPQIYNFITRQIVRMGLFCTRRRLSKYPKLRKTAKRLETIFGVCAPDTGWLIASKSKRDNLRTLLFDDVQEGTSPFNQYPFSTALDILSTEYELYQYENEPILTHKYSTNGYLWRTSFGKDTQYWLDLIRQTEEEMTHRA